MLDSTDPDPDPGAVLAVERELPWQHTVVVPASKSGGTIEMLCHLERFVARLTEARGANGVGEALIAITDPGSKLEARAEQEGFRAVVHGQPDVGGRFSALTPFGLVPAALLGLDLDAHLAPAARELEAARSTDPAVNAPAVLGAVLAAAHREGRDKLTLLLPEQLAAEVVRWEVATAVGGALLGLNPFDQPDVQAAKTASGRMLETGEDLPPTGDPVPMLDTLSPGDYLALLAFVTPGGEDEARLHAAADRLRASRGVSVTVGIGPRYLHSTGQLHKGGPDRGVFLVVVGDDPEDADIPGRDYGFSRLKRAQAAGDLAALREAGRRTVHLAVSRLDDLR